MGAKVLIIDDNVDGGECIKEYYEMQGHQAWTAFDGFAALELLKIYQPDIALVDLRLPGLNGFEVALRARQISKHVVLVAFTGYTPDNIDDEVRAAGFDKLLIKPCPFEALDSLVKPFTCSA